MSTLTDFIREELNPRLFYFIPQAFPSMEFTKYRGGWASKKKIDGQLSHDGKRDKSVITPRVPSRVLEQGGESLSLVDFYMRLNGKGLQESLSDLCRIVGLDLPRMENEEQYKAYKEKQDRLEKLNTRLTAALFSPYGKEVLNYLTEVRGYTEDFIRFAEFGCIDSQTMGAELKELQELLRYTNTDGQKRTLPFGVGQIHKLTIPFRSGSIQGFVFRSVMAESELKASGSSKYTNAFTGECASKKYHLFGLKGFNLTGDKERDRYITIVEGEIDALRASFAGVDNVVAMSQGNISPEALNEAKRRGVKGVTLLFDTGEQHDAEKAIRAVEGKNLTSFICSLPALPGEKMDVDSFLRNHSGKELQELISEATPGYIHLFNEIRQDTIKKQGGEGKIMTQKLLSEYEERVIDLVNSENIRPSVRDQIICLCAESVVGVVLTPESIKARADALREAKNRSRQKEETITLASEALMKAKGGKVDEAISLLQKKAPELRQISKETEFAQLLSPPTWDGIIANIRERPQGVKTPYFFDCKDSQEQLILPTGALSFICAPTSHGKSRMLENLALHIAKNGEGGDTLYFSFEEDTTAVTLQLLNIFINMRLSVNNMRTLHSYYNSGNKDFTYFDGGVDHKEFLRKEGEFRSLIESGKLRVFYKDYDSSDLIEAIKYYHKQSKIKAVFIDYAQLLHKRGCKTGRKDELQEICRDLMAFAVESSLPIVLAAQLNRQTKSPLEMEVQNIGEASDIEHSANIVLMLWNSVVQPLQGSDYSADGNRGKVSSLESKGFHIGEGGKLYAKLAKNRSGARNIDAVFSFDGNTGYIGDQPEDPFKESNTDI